METFEQMVRRINKDSVLADFPHTPKAKREKKHRLSKKAEALSQKQLQALIDLLEGTAVLVTIDGHSYAVTKTDVGHTVQNLLESKEYTVLNGECSCPDSRFREHPCKHVLALEKLK